MLGLGGVKNVLLKMTINICFVQKLVGYSSKRLQFAQIGSVLFDRHQLPLVSKFCKTHLSTVKTMWSSSFNNSHALNESDLNISAPTIRYESLILRSNLYLVHHITTKTHVDNSMSRKLLTSTLQFLCKIQKFSPNGSLFD